ncbi:hypothetical protein niasHT_000279 [Heterodera trifolii]|uniref:tRNA (adenine(58)-N(1))-methyltransferase non-catalytic subunit TRM6 n=1 Tax=Heterodera trifolii TaxID=157864 RepID=A0ABD2LTJ7_9BILA
MNWHQKPSKIHEGVFAIVRKVGGEHIRLCRLISGQRVLIERLSFNPKDAIGHFYGIFEVSNGGDVLCPIEFASKPFKTEFSNGNSAGDRGHGNESTQQLTSNQIMTLKEDGITTNELVSKLVSGNCHFQSRTKFSKEKYMRKKVQKHSDRVVILQPNIRLLADCYYRKDPERLGHLRIDQLGLMLQLSGLHSGKCNAFVFDQLNNGRDEEKTNNLKNTEEREPDNREDGAEERREQQIQKRMEREERERRAMEMIKPTAEHSGQIDSICMATRTVDPVDILKQVFAGLRLSGTIVIYSPVKEHLLNAWKWLRSVGSAVDIQLSQQFFRFQQVISDRTHPIMQQLISGGYVLYAIKVLPPESDQTQQRMLNKELLTKHSRIEQETST